MYPAASPLRARQLLRKVGVERIVVTPSEDGWTFEGAMNLGGRIDCQARDFEALDDPHYLVVDEGSTAPPGVAQRALAAGIEPVR